MSWTTFFDGLSKVKCSFGIDWIHSIHVIPAYIRHANENRFVLISLIKVPKMTYCEDTAEGSYGNSWWVSSIAVSRALELRSTESKGMV